MSVYQELYKKIGFQSKHSDEEKKKCFAVWKDKRNQEFDAKRQTLVCEVKDVKSNEKENKKPNKKMLIKWKNEKKTQKNKAAPKKNPPFVVGIVRHKLYSPPILYKPIEQKKKTHRKSFAPKNYRFKPPESLKFKVLTSASKKAASPFTFNSLFDSDQQIIENKKEHHFENVTVRHRAKPLTDSTPNKSTPKNTKINKDVINQKRNNFKETFTDSADEPPIFGKLNLLKFREKTAKENDAPNDASISDQSTSLNQNVKNSKSEDISYAPSFCNNQKLQESNLTEVNDEKESHFKPPTSYSCSQQIQNLLEQKNLRFTELHSNSEDEDIKLNEFMQNNQIIKRTSEVLSPNISRISFTPTDLLKRDNKIITVMEKIKEKNNSFENSGSPINDDLNVTIDEDKNHLVDEDTLKYFNFSTSITPRISSCKLTPSSQTENEVTNSFTKKDSNSVQDYLPERVSPDNENNKSKFNKYNSLNLTPIFTSKGDTELEGDKEENQLNRNESSLGEIELLMNDSKTLQNENLLETENNKLSNSNFCTEESSLIVDRTFNISNENMILQDDILNEQKVLEDTEATIKSNVATEKDNNTVSMKNFINNSTFELEKLSPRGHNNINLNSEINFSKSSTENNQMTKNNLNELSNDFVEYEKSTTLLKNQLPETLANRASINEMKENEKNDMQPEIIDLSDSPLKQEKVDYQKDALRRNLYDKITKELFSSPRKSLVKKSLNTEDNKPIKSEQSSSRKVSETVHLVDSLEVKTDFSTSLTIQNKFSYENLKEHQRKPVTDENSQTCKIETIDLISDDEEDAESLLSQIKARFAITTISSTKLNPERVALTSVENIQTLPRKTSQSQMFLTENSPKIQNISIRVSVCKSPRSPLLDKENSLVNTVASPLKNLSLNSQKIESSASPKKTEITPRKDLLTKHNSAVANSQTPKKNSDELRSQVQTAEDSSALNGIPLLVVENSPTSSVGVSEMRILSLRNRTLGVSPSPKKTRNTPRKALLSKNNLADTNSQTPKNNLDKLNEDDVALLPLQNVQNYTPIIPQRQDQAKEIEILNLHTVPSKTPQSKLLIKENSPLISVTASPMNILSLRSRKIDVSPSPKKTRKTPRKALFTKNLPDENGEMLKSNSDELNENRSTCNTPRLQEQAKETNIPKLHISPCEILRPNLLGKEDSPVTNTVSSPMRILCLRGRKVDVTPSPKKKTPKRTPRVKGTPAK